LGSTSRKTSIKREDSVSSGLKQDICSGMVGSRLGYASPAGNTLPSSLSGRGSGRRALLACELIWMSSRLRARGIWWTTSQRSNVPSPEQPSVSSGVDLTGVFGAKMGNSSSAPTVHQGADVPVCWKSGESGIGPFRWCSYGEKLKATPTNPSLKNEGCDRF